MLKKACLWPGRPPAETRLFQFFCSTGRRPRANTAAPQGRTGPVRRRSAARQKAARAPFFRAPGHGERAGMTAHASQAGRRGEPAGLLPGPGSPVPRRSSFSGSPEKQFIPNGPVSIRRSEGQRAAGSAPELRLPGSVSRKGPTSPQIPSPPSPVGQAKQNDKRPVRRCLSQRSCGQWGKTPLLLFYRSGRRRGISIFCAFPPRQKSNLLFRGRL